MFFENPRRFNAEVPQVFQVGNKWYCLFCTADIHWSEAYKRSFPQAPVTGPPNSFEPTKTDFAGAI